MPDDPDSDRISGFVSISTPVVEVRYAVIRIAGGKVRPSSAGQAEEFTRWSLTAAFDLFCYAGTYSRNNMCTLDRLLFAEWSLGWTF